MHLMPPEQETTYRVLICDDHRMLTDALSAIVDADPRLELVGSAVSDPFVAIDIAAEEKPDVVLMDVEMGAPIDGIEATRRVRDIAPETQVVILTAQEDRFLMLKAVEAGACSFLRKTAPIDEVLDAVCAAAEGRSLLDPRELSALIQEAAKHKSARQDSELLFSQLTEREREVLAAVASGQSNDEIAAALVLSPQTIQTHVRNILAKLGVHSKLEAVLFAARHGFVEIS
jgi:DNA-binding NarL/FixJ family response regulator